MLAAMKRHPIPMEAFFRHSLVLTYAFPEAVLHQLLPPGLELDTYKGFGFLAIALVQTERLRPAGWPTFMGKDFFLSGYRIFSRFKTVDGKVLRGLRIVRSDADSALMVGIGNLFTHYRYRQCRVELNRSNEALELRIHTPHAEADLSVRVDLAVAPIAPPVGSPFPDLTTARKYAGPLPYTFDFEPSSRGMVLIQGVRRHWLPRPVSVTIDRCTFFNSEPFQRTQPVLANAFLVEDTPYRWERGILVPLEGESS